MKKTVLLSIVMVLALSMAITGSIAYLSDTDSDVNVMTLGNVDIEQLEYQRVVENGAWVSTDKTDNYGYTPDKLEEFTQAKPLYPAYFEDGIIKWDDRNGSSAEDGTGHQQSWGQIGASGSNQLFDDSVKGAQDKFVFVKNTGSSDAYVRTWFAFEQGSIDGDNFENIICTNGDEDHWDWKTVATDVEIDGNQYVVACATYMGPQSKSNGILAAGDTSYPSLLQVYMMPTATNDDVKAIDGNGDGLYNILVFSQAVQTINMPEDPAKALEVAFGPVTSTDDNGETVVNHPWTEGVEVKTDNGVIYVIEGDTATVSAAEGDTLERYALSDGYSEVKNVVVKEGITTLGNRSLCKAPLITSVTLPNSLTYIDESVFQQSGVKELEIPENVTYIGKQAMGACGNLEKIIIRAKNVTIANYIARACANLKEVYFYSDSVTFESGSMYFTNKENADASGITFYVKDQAMADNLYAAFSTSHSYGLLIKSLDGATTYYNTLK